MKYFLLFLMLLNTFLLTMPYVMKKSMFTSFLTSSSMSTTLFRFSNNLKFNPNKLFLSKKKYEYEHNKYELPKKNRIVVIGDIHGDMTRLTKVLIDAKIINTDFKWIAEPYDTTIVQLGDQVDDLRIRNNEIIEWNSKPDFGTIIFTDFLSNLAKRNGGNFISLIGNHELLNTKGNFEYVSKKNRVKYRHELFMPGGYYTNILAKRPIVLKIGDYIFCHGGIKMEHLIMLEECERNIYELNYIWSDYMNNEADCMINKYLLNQLIFSSNGILWTRNINGCVNEVLNKLKSKYMIVGHTIVPEITLKDDKIWYVDTGLSKKYGKNEFQYLDIIDDEFNIKTVYDKLYNDNISSIEDLQNEADKYIMYDNFYNM